MAKLLSLSRPEKLDVPEGPTLHSVAPDWVELTDQLQKRETRRAELIARIGPLNKTIGASGLGLWREQNRRPKELPPPIKASPGAAALLGEKFTPAPIQPELVGPKPPAAVAELQEISDELKTIDEAIALIHPQLLKARLEGSARLCEQLLPDYRRVAGRICAALVELGRAHVEHDQFLHKHRSAALSKLRPVHGAGSLGDPRDPSSELRRLLEWAAECGHFDQADIPKEWAERRSAGEIYQWPEARGR